MKKLFGLLLLCLVSQVYSQNLTDSLLLYLPFEGNSIDESGYNNTIEVFGAQPTADRFYKENSAYYFDGLDDFIQIDTINALSVVSDFTISLWYSLTAWEDQPYIVTNVLDFQYIFDGHSHSSEVFSDFFASGFNVAVMKSADSTTMIRNGTSKSNGYGFSTPVDYDIQFNKWVHNVFIREGDTTKLYVNGNLAKEAYNDGHIMQMNHNLYLGTFSGNNPYYNNFNYNFNGKIDDIRIYNRALDSIDVAYLYYGVCGSDQVVYDRISVTDTLIIDVTITDINEIEKNSIKIYPNPAKDYLIIDNGSYELLSNYSLKIVDMQSTIVFESEINSQKFQIDINDFGKTGLYIIQIYNSDNVIVMTKKLILE